MGNYEVLDFTLNGEVQPLASYEHNAPFVEGDTRTIRYNDGSGNVAQVFYGETNTGGWYDEE